MLICDWRSCSIAVNIITNGFLFTEEILAKLRTLRIESVSVSVDGTEELHDRYRQKGSYARAFRAISVLREAGIPVSVITTLNAENVRALPKLYESLRETGIGAWQLQACSPMGSAWTRTVRLPVIPVMITVATVRDT